MDAEELYQASLSISGSSGGINTHGLSKRVYFSLCRAEIFTNDDRTINVKQLKTSVLDGTIWGVRGIGDASVHEICHWIINKELTEE